MGPTLRNRTVPRAGRQTREVLQTVSESDSQSSRPRVIHKGVSAVLALNDYQRQAAMTDIRTRPGDFHVLLMGLAEEVGALNRLGKKAALNGQFPTYTHEASERLGDILWYVARSASAIGVKLSDVALSNLKKNRDRWLGGESNRSSRHLYDDSCPPEDRLPRRARFRFEQVKKNNETKVILSITDEMGNSLQQGDQIDDNSREEDGYRFHDIFHIAHAVFLGGWSPILRTLLHRKRKSQPDVDRIEDGARAKDLEEAITAMIHKVARHEDWFANTKNVDTNVLKAIKLMTSGLEVQTQSLRDWEIAILEGYRIFRKMWIEDRGRGGYVTMDLHARKMEYEPLHPQRDAEDRSKKRKKGSLTVVPKQMRLAL